MPLDYDEVPVFRGQKRPSGGAEGVRIPISPPYLYEKALIIQGFFVSVFLKKLGP